MTQIILFTDLDGILLNNEADNDITTRPLIQKLKALKIPIIPVTSKTRAEVVPLRQDMGLSDPFITENGGGIFIPKDAPFDNPPGELDGDYYVVALGCPYVQARAGLRVIANNLQHSLLGFGDLTIERLQKRTGLTATEAQQTKAREFSEPFITPKAVPAEQLTTAAEEMGFRVVVEDRFSHLLGPNASKATAIKQLVDLYQTLLPAGENITTLGLGNSPTDLEMLHSIDIPIVLPGASGPHPQLSDKGWQVAPAPGPEGWVSAVQNACKEMGIKL